MGSDKTVSERLWAFAIWALVIFFIINVVALVAAVVVNSFGTRWFNAWLPAGFTMRWYASAWQEFQLNEVLIVTFEVVGAVVLLSGLLGVPAAYALARRNFPGKRLILLLFLLPMMIPPITFGIPLATARSTSRLICSDSLACAEKISTMTRLSRIPSMIASAQVVPGGIFMLFTSSGDMLVRGPLMTWLNPSKCPFE